MTAILVIGRTGQLAQALARSARGAELVFAGRDEIDLANPAGVRAEVLARHPRAVINAAAYTAVDRAESEPDLALAINGRSVGELAAACKALGAPLVHVSTDYVFDGSKTSAYREEDPISPLGAYGRSKAAGESQLLEAGPTAAILRTAWVYGPTGANFVRTMLRLAETREEVGVVADQYGCPTHAEDLADACLAMADRLMSGDTRAEGVFHYAGEGEAAWADVAEETFAAAQRIGLPAARVRRITTAEYPTPARRPANSRLDCTRIRSLGLPLRAWRDRVSACVDAIARASA